MDHTNNTTIEEARQNLANLMKDNELEVPVLPKVANDILFMSEDANANISELSKLIHQDQSIAGRVLKIANSAAFASSERIVSLQQAVARLGMQLLSEIALSVAVQGNVFNSPRYKKEIQLLWRHALASAVYGKEVARFLRKNVEGHYLCGLLHAIGKPVALKTIENFENEHNIQLERETVIEMMDEFHVSIGVYVTGKWNLPRTVQIANEHYKDYSNAPEFKQETAITYLADKLAENLVFPEQIQEKDLLFDPVFEELNIYPQDRKGLLEKKEEVQVVVNSMDF